MKMKGFVFSTLLILGAVSFINAEEKKTYSALDPPQFIQPITENYDDAHRKFQCVSTLCVTDNNRIWASWYAGGMNEGEENYILLSTSGDGGLTWSAPLFAIDPEGPVRAFDEILWTDPNGRVWLFWGQGGGKEHKTFQWETHTDNPQDGENAVWSKPRLLSEGLMLAKPIVDSKGRWLYPFQMPQGASVSVSTDGGKTVEFVGTVNTPEEYQGADEHNLLEKKDGTLWLYNRLRVPGIGEFCSKDGGKTWSDFKLTDIQHPISRFFFFRLNSGNLLLVKHGEMDEFCARTRLMAFLSEDDGQTWSKGLMIEPRFRCSYPDGDQAPDGTIYLTYDRNRGLEREIFCAKITEEDIKAGKLVSPQSKLNIIINQPTDEFNSWWEGAVRYPKENGMPGEYWDTEKVLEVIKEIERGEHDPIKNF